jgi:hypothetical protein
VDVANIHVGWSAELTQTQIQELWDIEVYEGTTPHLKPKEITQAAPKYNRTQHKIQKGS